MIKAVFFDFDGVLTKDVTGTTTIINYIKSNTHLNALQFENAYRKHNLNLLYGKTTHEEIWPQICEELGEDIDFNILIDSFLSTPMDADILNISMRLKKNDYLIGIITDNKKDRIDSIFLEPKYNSIFDKIVVSSEIGSGKRKQPIFDAAILGLDCNFTECIFIDNNRENLIIPRDLGIETIFFDHTNRDCEKLESEIQAIIERENIIELPNVSGAL